jgi:hypothetical protein
MARGNLRPPEECLSIPHRTSGKFQDKQASRRVPGDLHWICSDETVRSENGRLITKLNDKRAIARPPFFIW